MSYWFKDKPFVPHAEVLVRMKAGPLKNGIKKHNDRVAEIKNQRELGIQEVGKLSKRELWLLGIGLYIGEGSKSAEITRVSNADPAVIKLAVAWFKEACGLTDENLSIRLHLYPDNDEQECVAYWQASTGLPLTSFKRSTIDRRTNK